MYNIDGLRKPIGRPRQQMLMVLKRHAHYNFIDVVISHRRTLLQTLYYVTLICELHFQGKKLEVLVSLKRSKLLF